MPLMFWTGFWVFLLDQVSKYYVVHMLNLDVVRRIEVFDPYLVLQMAWNRGVNFGIGAGLDMRWALIVLALAISLGATIWLWRSGATRWGYIAGGLLVGGALGNVVDRVLYGAVADFLNMSCCGFTNPYAFNVADISIFIGAVALALLPEPQHKKRRA